MKKILLGLLLAALCSCAYSHVKTPLDTNVENTRLGSKQGKSSAYSVLGLVAWGDAGTEAAAKDGNLQVITHLDLEYEIYLFGLYMKTTTVAYGD